MAQQIKITQTSNADMNIGIPQQTAVEWLFQKMTEQGTNPYWDMRFIQAKQMEKEQIINAWVSGVVSKNDMTAEQYYNETYESNTRV